MTVMNNASLRRRSFLTGLAATTMGAPLLLSSRRARAQAVPRAQRAIFVYFPDGVPGPSSNGEPSAFHPTGSESAFTLPDVLSPLQPYRDHCLFFRGLSLGPTDAGSHPGGARKLLTASDGGNGWSVDHYLAETAGAHAPFRHLYLGAMANVNNASGDKHITYVANGQSTSPEDDPAAAFRRVFDGFVPPPADPSQPSPPSQPAGRSRRRSVIDGVLAEMHAFRARAGNVEATKLDLHLEALREVEGRIAALEDASAGGASGGGASGGGAASGCGAPTPSQVPASALYDPGRFPEIVRAQTDLLVSAMACGLTRVGTLQMSVHTSELIMSRFSGTALYDPGFDMRSHQASHYGPAHDPAKREYAQFVLQRKWFVEQFAHLLGQLQARPEGEGTMLDHTVVVLCTEVCDGNTHSHDDMPFVVAGRAGGAFRTGRLLDVGYRRHGALLAAVARAMGQDIGSYGDGEAALSLG